MNEIKKELLEFADSVRIDADRYVLRTIRTAHGMPTDETIEAVVDCLEKAFDKLFYDPAGIDLFVTLVGGCNFACGPDENICLGIYHSGLFHVALAGLEPDEPIDDDYVFIDELRKTVIHEMLHFRQEIKGEIDDTKELETKTDQETERIYGELFRSPPPTF